MNRSFLSTYQYVQQYVSAFSCFSTHLNMTSQVSWYLFSILFPLYHAFCTGSTKSIQFTKRDVTCDWPLSISKYSKETVLNNKEESLIQEETWGWEFISLNSMNLLHCSFLTHHPQLTLNLLFLSLSSHKFPTISPTKNKSLLNLSNSYILTNCLAVLWTGRLFHQHFTRSFYTCRF